MRSRKVSVIALFQSVFSRASDLELWDNREPIREELFSIERLEEHARSLAKAQKVDVRRNKGRPLTRRLDENGAILLGAYKNTVKAIEQGRAITPAAEWLIDNFHLIEKQIRQTRSDLPEGYYRQLPKLTYGPFAGYPRVFGLAWAFIAHTDSRFDPEMLLRYLAAYQQVQQLTIGELWAVSITLRIVLIENLGRLAEQTVQNRTARQTADQLADRLLGAGEAGPEPALSVLAGYQTAPLTDAFAVQLVHRLRDQDPKFTPALTWLDQRLEAQGVSADIAVRDVHRRQGASNVSVRNIVTSLRLISDVDWKDLFEGASLVDSTFAACGSFADMDFPTRNLYRGAIEQLARGSDYSEVEIAGLAAQAAIGDPQQASDERMCDPGYHLLAGGRGAFERKIGFRAPLSKWPARLHATLGIGGYAAAIAVTTAILLAAPLLWLAHVGLGVGWIVLLGALGLVPAIDAAVAFVNRSTAFTFDATLLPGLELRNGIPSSLRTLVAVPSLLTTPQAVEELIEHLEIHHLASPDGDLHFAMLSDWTDADSERTEGDQALLAAATSGIARLNARYGPAPGGARFLLLHRRRIWNESEQRWIGWERKRGKLHELNRLLRGAPDTTFTGVDASDVPSNVRYVVTLDSDTRLPRDTIKRLIGKMAHPLNRPRFDDAAGRVIEGYAILQPRVTPSLPVGREGSFFQRIFSSLSGIDPYASAVSDVYQDLFGEGSYAGKGIYDVDAFEAALAGRAPDSTLLSHDLFEGIFARAGLASDIEVVEEFPARYDVGALRHHRWARGDWQLLPWILGIAASGAKVAVPILGRWKMVDNLRRTLTAPSTILALLVGWLLPAQAAFVWTLFVLSTIVLPALLPVATAIPPRAPGIAIASHMRALGGDFRLALTLSALNITFLADQASLMADAIARTLWRLAVTRRRLLEWTPAAQAKIGPRLDLAGFYRRMRGAPAIGVAGLLASVLLGHGAWVLAAPFAALWAASPAIARWISRPPANAGRLEISESDARKLRLTARSTWRFFETFVTSADSHLPPDNFQETPQPALAHRTSPTNIGLYLLSVASARDFGWIIDAEAAQRLEATFATLREMERFRGHFYNWYDTRELRPLDPKYVSSVDSGNLAGHLIALANACRQWCGDAPDISRGLAGVADALDLARDEAARLQDGPRTQTTTMGQLDDALTTLALAVHRPPADEAETGDYLAALCGLADTIVDIARAIAAERGDGATADLLYWVQAGSETLQAHSRNHAAGAESVRALAVRLARLEREARTMALEMEFGFLLDRERGLLSIGYLVPEGLLDTNCYDLLASEARLASFLAIAKGDIPARHWFRLGRTATPVAHGAALISWSGSMFEYLMPSLVMRAPEGSLLEQTNRLAVHRQIAYAASQNAPWGISESAYNARDLEFTYQYSNFGVPSLGLKRGLNENLVIAPYATALAAMVDPHVSAANLARLEVVGARGRYGFYEALDYTAARIPEGEALAVVNSFMAHHQGMTIVAIADALLHGLMRERFHSEPIVQATELLLQERMPRDVAVVRPWAAEVKSGASARDIEPSAGRRFLSPHQTTPATHLLSNGRYTTMLTTAGSGYSRWGDLAITRWREDATCDDYGSYIYLRDLRAGDVWSTGFQPTGVEPDSYHVAFNEDRAEFARRDGSLTTTTEVLVSAEHDAEIRRVSICNAGVQAREIEVTSYAELVLAPQAADLGHPAFSKLFVETEYLPDFGAILATRRRRAQGEPEIWAAHLSVVDGETIGKPEIETDRARFVGRGHLARAPIAVIDGRALSNSVGAVLDPVFAIRRRVRIAPGATVSVSFWTMVASTRAALLDSVDKHRDTTAFGRATTLAWTQAQVQLNHLGIAAGQAALFQRLAGHVIFSAATLRPSSDTIRRGAGSQSGLWGQSISGDVPIILLRIADIEHIEIVHELLQAHEYLRLKQLAVDVVIVNERQSSYVQDLQVAIETMVRTSQSRSDVAASAPGGRVFVLRADLIPAETRALLSAVARVVLVAQRGSLFDQLGRVAENVARPRPEQKRKVSSPDIMRPAPELAADLEFFNGLGGFADNGREYVTVLGPGQSTPAPWINVVANPAFGFQSSTDGSGYTWSVNSRENQITPWSNDPVSDRPGEAIYLQDDQSGEIWTPTALPIRSDTGTYVARHGRGYCRFEHVANGIESDLLQYVPMNGALKISRLVLRNRTTQTRRISVTSYVEWVLGPSRSSSIPFLWTDIDPATGALFARNPWNTGFGPRVAFLHTHGVARDWTADRREFIGRNGSLASPAALTGREPLSKSVGAGLDPCAALRTTIVLSPNGEAEVVFLLGEAANAEDARALIERHTTDHLEAARSEVAKHWDDFLGAVVVKTPDRAMDIMLNGWLLYQTLACRVWARSAFYQSSGAYGFRDQLQDGMSLTAARPDLTREHILRAAGRQFVEGDVQHWWLPHSGQGVRTRISDDRAWLAYAVARYIDATGDFAILDEQIAFLEGRALEPGEHDCFFPPLISEASAPLFEHCALALDRSLALGGHGLPLIGGGDWNDGMNRVGEHGLGESVWLGWLLYSSLSDFAEIADRRGEAQRAVAWRAHASALQASLEREAWDGDWYCRGFYDDGTPLGSTASDECRIDSIAQSWATLSGAATPARAARAMAAVERELIRPGDGVALLFAPPFDKTTLEPGYIKGYPPGVRENGGQYTHAAVWSAMAFARLGEGDRAHALFALLNPINHARTRADVHRYKVEPYVVAADVYGMPSYLGRGGWTWYTGAAGWLQRAGVESILGVRKEGDFLVVDPCVPIAWTKFEITIRNKSATYEIVVDNPDGVSRGVAHVQVDGARFACRPLRIPMLDDGRLHQVIIRLG